MTPARVRPATFLRPATVGLLALTMVGAVPAPASAQFGVRHWLEKLSGPGPFTGSSIYVAPLCVGYRKPKEPEVSEKTTEQRLSADPVESKKKFRSGLFRLVPPVRPKSEDRPSRGSDVGNSSETPPSLPPAGAATTRLSPEEGQPTPRSPEKPANKETTTARSGLHLFPAWECASAFDDEPHFLVYYEFGFYRSKFNHLEYPPGPDGSAPQVTVGVQSHLVGVAVSVHPALDVGVGIGRLRINPDFGGLDPFWKATLQPLRVNFKPAAAFTDAAWAEGIMLTSQVFILKGELNDTDFGARPNTYREGSEAVWSMGVTVDALRLLSSLLASCKGGS